MLYSLFPADIKTFGNFDFELFEKIIQFSGAQYLVFPLSFFQLFYHI